MGEAVPYVPFRVRGSLVRDDEARRVPAGMQRDRRDHAGLLHDDDHMRAGGLLCRFLCVGIVLFGWIFRRLLEWLLRRRGELRPRVFRWRIPVGRGLFQLQVRRHG